MTIKVILLPEDRPILIPGFIVRHTAVISIPLTLQGSNYV